MNSKIKITYRDENGNEILNPIDGQKSYSPETKKIYIYKDNKWNILDGDIGLGLNLYDMNKQIISQLDCLTKEEMLEACDLIRNYANITINKHYMLLCREKNYYTMFRLNILDDSLENFAEVVLDCATDLGVIKSVTKNEDNVIEIWAQPINDEPVVMFLFPYDAGVVECTL